MLLLDDYQRALDDGGGKDGDAVSHMEAILYAASTPVAADLSESTGEAVDRMREAGCPPARMRAVMDDWPERWKQIARAERSVESSALNTLIDVATTPNPGEPSP